MLKRMLFLLWLWRAFVMHLLWLLPLFRLLWLRLRLLQLARQQPRLCG